MPRKMRVQYPGAIFHVLSRGDRREPIFLDDVDRQDFLQVGRIAQNLSACSRVTNSR